MGSIASVAVVIVGANQVLTGVSQEREDRSWILPWEADDERGMFPQVVVPTVRRVSCTESWALSAKMSARSSAVRQSEGSTMDALA